MTKKDLVKIIQEVVRIEVKKQVKQIFITEKKSSSLKSLAKKEFKEPIRKEYKKREKVQYTSNLTLNNILNETVGGIEGMVKWMNTQQWVAEHLTQQEHQNY
jgi:D-arabinose 5-phosphate isomerase GutQ